MGSLPPVFIEFLGSATGFHATAKGVKTELASVEAQGGGNMARLGGVAKAALLGIGVAAAVTAVKTVHMAGDFQTAMTRVRTGAGEAAGNMKLVSDGVLKMAGEVGQSTGDLAKGLYTVESAGFHANDALTVLRTSSQGAKVGAADLATVTDAVTTALNAYKLGAGDANMVMNALVATEANGKTNLEALAGSMSSILPVSAAAHVGLNEVMGAMATMTMQGTNAKVAATYLRQTIGQLSNPTAKASAAMQSLGLKAVDVSKNLGSKGLASTLTMLTDAIQKHMGPAGTVIMSTLAKASKSSTDFQGALNKLTGPQKTYIGALATMVGGTKSMMGALQLTGTHMATFKDNTKKVAEQVKKGGNSVEGWSAVQGTYNQKMAEAKGAMQALGITIGNQLLPAATKFAGWLATSVGFLASHKNVLEAFAIGLTAVSIGLTAATVASWDFNASLWADPLTWIVAGIIALIAALVLLVIHWRDVWNWIKSASTATVNWVVAAWHWLASGTVSIWHTISAAVVSAWHSVGNFLSSAWHTVTDPIVGAWHWVQRTTVSVWNAIAGFFKKWWPLLLVIFLPAVALILGLWNWFHQAIFDAAVSTWHTVSNFLAGIWAGIVGIAQTIWAGIVTYVITPMKMIWAALQSVWHTASAFLHSQWQVISTVAHAAWVAIRNSIINPIMSAYHSVAKTVGNIGHSLKTGFDSAYKSVTNTLGRWADIGRNIVLGIVHGVEHSASSLFTSLGNLANDALKAAKSALHINSPSKLFADHVGRGIAEGVALGVDTHAVKVHSAVTSLANGTVSTFSKALGINSPSKVFQSLGVFINEGLIAGLTGSQAKVKSTTQRLATMLAQAYNKVANLKGTKGVSNHWVASHEKTITHLEAYAKKEDALLNKLASQRATVASKLKSAQTNLANLQKAWTTERNNIASSIMQGTSIVMQPVNQGDGVSVGDIVSNMQSQVQSATQFAANLQALKKKGLNSALIEQIASSGVDQGGATAAALANANTDQIKQLNGMQKTLTSSANSTGAAVADSMYSAGINSAKGLVKGLKSQEKAIDKQMLKIAESMKKAIKQALGIKSPSTVFHEFGRFVSQGLANGIDASSHLASTAAGSLLANSLGPITADRPSLSHGSGGHVIHNTVNVTVQGTVRSERDLRDVLQQEILRLNGRNTSNGLTLKR